MTPNDLDWRVVELFDRDQIRELVNRYFDAVWRQDVDAVADCFTENGCFEFVGLKVGEDGRPDPSASRDHRQSFEGREALRLMYQATLSEMRPLPFGHNLTIELDGPCAARGRLVMEMRGAADLGLIGFVTYEDDYAKDGDRWRFRKRLGRILMPGR